ncbi:HTH-type transcriptional regulatory protein gabR [Buttiauxella agrestis]|uniref:HTH-type transcriptional regulatory protein gabR n=1 Tax=Buttiauxella agrestis TaxID=82977 RepID=A0A381C1Z0_9ENTR|nr:PLP-dependent aminotransferase family protein [Buttiauxella agrestis]SUW61896.1 HTH-type transcriptional regulatory protein gabR [Buttiauxella agrestis]
MQTKPSFELTGITLQPGRKRTEQLYIALRERILTMPGSGGAKLPATRELAKLLGISRNTVVNVYERLYAEGFLEVRLGDGTFIKDLSPVAPEAPEVRINFPRSVRPRLLHAEAFNRHLIHGGLPKAFRIGLPALDQFPFEVWSRLQNRFWRRHPIQHMGYGDPAGDLQLRELLAHYLRNTRGIKCEPSQILITLGAQQAIMTATGILTYPGDNVVLENPCYWAAAGVFSCLGLNINPINVDEEGLMTDQLNDYPDARLAYVSPSCQYPTGATMSLPRRIELLNWAQQNQAWIIEDDYDGEYRYSGTPIMPLAALDKAQRVLYIGSFSKVMYPSLRLGYLVAPAHLVENLVLLRTLSSRQPPINDQRVMADFIAEGYFHPHIRRMRRVSLARRNTLLAAWREHLSHIGEMPEVNSGLHVTVRLVSQEREQELHTKAAAAGVEITPLSSLWLAGAPENANHYGLILGFAGISEPDILSAVLTLKQAWL